MFRRKWSGLPKDAVFPSNLKDLGYLINEDDEIRNEVDTDYYFNYHLTKNHRVNGRQRFNFNDAIQDVVRGRLEAEGLETILLPLGTQAAQPHVPIFASADLKSKSRVVVIFGEPNQDLGNLALRVANGPGGINKGTMVSVVRDLRKQTSGPGDDSSPGILLANTGAVFWWPEGQRALTLSRMADMPLASLAHHGRRILPANQIPKAETEEEHIRYIFEEVLPALAKGDARIDIIGIGLSADMVEVYLDQEDVWAIWGGRVNTFTIIGGVTDSADLKCQPFKDFLAKRARAYITSEEPADTPLAGPLGNTKESIFLNHGTAAVYSSGEPYYVEMIMVRVRETILGWLGEVAAVGVGKYCHPEIMVVDVTPQMENVGKNVWATADTEWKDVPAEVKPSISFGDTGEDDGQAGAEKVDVVLQVTDDDKVVGGGKLDEEAEKERERERKVAKGWDLLMQNGSHMEEDDDEDEIESDETLARVRSPRTGALVLFAGTTRDSFAGKPVRELHYTAYAPRALRTMAAVADEVRERHGLEGVAIVHRLGTVPIGEESVLIAVAAAHRGPAWRAGEEALELVKERVEVWKREEFFGEEGVWRANRDGVQGVYESAKKEEAGQTEASQAEASETEERIQGRDGTGGGGTEAAK
ncbi:hypothetical protein ACHAQA_008989 [Verticillium albo-atrum]